MVDFNLLSNPQIKNTEPIIVTTTLAGFVHHSYYTINQNGALISLLKSATDSTMDGSAYKIGLSNAIKNLPSVFENAKQMKTQTLNLINELDSMKVEIDSIMNDQ